jgi:hypothetical protein
VQHLHCQAVGIGEQAFGADIGLLQGHAAFLRNGTGFA